MSAAPAVRPLARGLVLADVLTPPGNAAGSPMHYFEARLLRLTEAAVEARRRGLPLPA